METPVRGKFAGDVSDFSRVGTCFRRLFDPLDRIRIDVRQCPSRGALLQQSSQVVDLDQVGYAELRYEIAASRKVRDLALLLEHAQRFTHGREAQTSLLGDRLLVHPLSRLERTCDDEPAQTLDGVLLGGAGRRWW